jgi:Ser/Thr protein kinase RdoA (MazF antagonist)
VIDQVASFHARWWGQPALASGFPVGGRDPRKRQERYAAHVDLFMERCGDRLPHGISDVLERLRSRLAEVARALHARQKTLIHADLHLDNLLFDARGDERSVTVLDWQTVSIGAPAWDVALFLFASLSVDDRRTAENELFERYVDLLSSHGVREFSSEDLRLDCGLASLLVLAGTVGWLATVDRDASARERALQDAVLSDGRLFTAVIDHGKHLL